VNTYPDLVGEHTAEIYLADRLMGLQTLSWNLWMRWVSRLIRPRWMQRCDVSLSLSLFNWQKSAVCLGPLVLASNIQTDLGTLLC